MKIIPVSEAKRRIKDLVERVSESGEVYYITRYSEAKAVVLGVERYEELVQRVGQLEDGLVRVWAAIEGAEGAEPLMLPTPDGRWRPFRPTHPVPAEVSDALERAARLAWQRRDWSRERTVAEGSAAVERSRREAVAGGATIDDEREAALGD